MPSDAQIDANRRNARNSTGPRTGAGKERSRRNALRHGLAAEHILILDEDAEDFLRFSAALKQALDPAGEAETVLCDRIVMGNWRLRRVWRQEAASLNEEAIKIAHREAREEIYEQVLAELKANPPAPPPDRKPWEPPPSLRAIAWDVVQTMTDAQVEEAVTAKGDAAEDGAAPEAEAKAEPPPPPERSPQKPDRPIWPESRMTALSRYEASIERALHRATAALDRLQARRREASPLTLPLRPGGRRGSTAGGRPVAKVGQEAAARTASHLTRQQRRAVERARIRARRAESAERTQFAERVSRAAAGSGRRERSVTAVLSVRTGLVPASHGVFRCTQDANGRQKPAITRKKCRKRLRRAYSAASVATGSLRLRMRRALAYMTFCVSASESPISPKYLSAAAGSQHG